MALNHLWCLVSVLIVLLYVKSSISHHTLHTAAACFGKRFLGSGFNFSHLDDVPLRDNGDECGEDDFSINQRNGIILLNVADGVGSWKDIGVNPKIFSNELLKSITDEFLELKMKTLLLHEKSYMPFLKRIIANAFGKLRETKAFIKQGSSTLVSLSLNIETLTLNTYVLGDSGFMIIRDRTIYYRSTDLQHGFNWPFQLAFVEEHSDDPLMGKTVQFETQPHDIIIIGSDGLFDNLFDEAILYYVNEETLFMSKWSAEEFTEAAKKIAKNLTVIAKRIGEIYGSVSSPFSEEINYLGFLDGDVYTGKNDDTTVVVAIIT